MKTLVMLIFAAMIVIPIIYWLWRIHWTVALLIIGIGGLQIINEQWKEK